MTTPFDYDKDEVVIHDNPEYKAAIYESAIKEMAMTRSEKTLFNSGAENAVLVLENILLQSKEINIFAGNFNKRVCDDSSKRFERSLRTFLLNKGKISVILNEYNSSDKSNNTLNILKEYAAEEKYSEQNIKIRTTDQKPFIGGNFVHYTIGDASMYRLEFDTVNFRAQFCFNDKDVSERLNKDFQERFAVATPLNLRLP
jgi:hypothetical protein